jgi:SAM-dependent methyltransferase
VGADEGYFGERVAAVYDQHSGAMFDPAVVGPAADRLAELAGDGAALEFAIGTGRIALPLAERGVRVSGIDNSAAMLARLREKPGAERVPEPQRLPLGQTVLPWRADPSGLSFYVYDVVSQRLGGQHYYLEEDGSLRPSPTEMRYAWHSELDLMARLAGMELEDRWGGWDREPFTGLSPAHVSVYRKP